MFESLGFLAAMSGALWACVVALIVAVVSQWQSAKFHKAMRALADARADMWHAMYDTCRSALTDTCALLTAMTAERDAALARLAEQNTMADDAEEGETPCA